MALVQDIVTRVRQELGDLGVPFRNAFAGTGEQGELDLTESSISQCTVTWIQGAAVTTLVADRDYQLLPTEGRVLLLGAHNPLPEGVTLLVEGQAGGMFTDPEVEVFANEAIRMHCANRRISRRTKDPTGFIRIVELPLTLANLPEIELLPLSLLATVNALWALATDASTDIDISTADGTAVPRSQRFRQIMAQIDAVDARYRDYCQQLNIGFYRIEMTELRRISRTTARYVPLYIEREFDDYSFPVRRLPEIDHRDDDVSGIPDAGWEGGYW